MKEVLDKIYSTRHTTKDAEGGGSSSFEEERGKLFVNWAGTSKKILDLGCRDGRIARYLIMAGNEVVGFDVDSAALKRCPLGMKTEWHDLNGDWHLGHEGEFDIVVATEVIEHLYFPGRVMEKILFVLKSGGLFVGSVPNAFNLKNRFRLFLAQPQNTPLGEPTHINQFSCQMIKALLSKYFKNVIIGAIVQPKWYWLVRLLPGLGGFLITFKAEKNENHSFHN
jgi:2-polyprenyl-3-methyl-5-hydroxy-6-metoxy-1,4-benzoquinol methylase